MNKCKKKLLGVFMILASISVYAQQPALQHASSQAHETLRAEKLNVVLVKDIAEITDTTNAAHPHDPHKSSFKIVHVNFNLVSSDPSTKGNKTVIMRLIDPHGVDIYDPVSGGGLFMLNGKETPYTYKYSGLFNGKDLAIDFLYKHPKHFKHGLHIIELYVDGYKIGEEHFVIK
jgi:hypothetical protein